jgi:acyl-CoA thioesterase-1
MDHRSRLLVAALATSVVGCGGTEPPPRPDGVAFRIAFLGDSLSAGYGLSESQAFPALVQDQLRQRGHPVDVLNAGVSGDTTTEGLSRVDRVLRSQPNLLVVELGANDALRGQPLEKTERNLREIVRRGSAAGASVLLLGMGLPTSFGPEYTDGFAEMYGRIAEEEEVELLPGFLHDFGLDPTLTLPDGIHPSAAGHRILADKLLASIETLLSEP